MEDEWVTAKTRTYAWGLDIQGSLQGAAGVGGLVAVHDKIENPSGKLLLPGYDANGNVAVMVNGTNGDLEAAYEYGPFGESLRQEGPSAKVNPFRFSTKYTDDETGLNYYGRRYYDPRNGRFLGRDPLEEGGGINLYAFVANNTVNTWDYLGMSKGQLLVNMFADMAAAAENEDRIMMGAFDVNTTSWGGNDAAMFEMYQTQILNFANSLLGDVDPTVFAYGGGGGENSTTVNVLDK